MKSRDPNMEVGIYTGYETITADSCNSDSSSDLHSSSKKKNKKRSKKSSKKAKRQKVSTIADVVRRYRRVLKLIKGGLKMTKAFKKANVSRNSVKDTVAIAEIYMVDKSVLEQFKEQKHTLLKLAKLCKKKIVGELAEKIIEMKRKKQLIPLSVKKD